MTKKKQKKKNSKKIKNTLFCPCNTIGEKCQTFDILN